MDLSYIEPVEDEDGRNVIVTEKLEVNVDMSLESEWQATESREEWFIATSEEIGEVEGGLDAEGGTTEVREGVCLGSWSAPAREILNHAGWMDSASPATVDGLVNIVLVVVNEVVEKVLLDLVVVVMNVVSL